MSSIKVLFFVFFFLFFRFCVFNVFSPNDLVSSFKRNNNVLVHLRIWASCNCADICFLGRCRTFLWKLVNTCSLERLCVRWDESGRRIWILNSAKLDNQNLTSGEKCLWIPDIWNNVSVPEPSCRPYPLKLWRKIARIWLSSERARFFQSYPSVASTFFPFITHHW